MAAARAGAVALVLAAVAVAASALNTDGLALLALKFAVSDDPYGALSTWRDADADPCGWSGVSCADGGGGRVAGVELANFSLAGYLPSELSLLSELETLSLPYNRLSGQIPVAITALQKLITLDLAHNLLSGQIPAGIGRLASLSRLDLSTNQLNGSLPPAIAGLPRLSGVLNLSYNHFTGGIPPEFGGIPVAVSLDLRGNDLAGEIPQVGSLVNQGPTAFDDNPWLCGFPLKVECAGEREEPRIPEANTGLNPGAAAEAGRPPKRRSSLTVPILAVIVVTAILAGVVLQWQCRRRCAATTRDEEKESMKEKSGAVTLAGSEDRRSGGGEGEVFVAVDDGFGLELEELLRASAYVVGKSRGGIVYRVVPGHGPAVAVRRLSEPDDGDGADSGWRRRRAFEAEAAAIGRARHPNVACLRAYYYAPDEKLLIYDYLPNGSLHSALHGGPTASPAPLPWSVRLSIVQGAAQGLAYLHECSTRRYVHGCIKSSKILLDDELRAHVSGFGLARLVAGAHKTSHSKKLGSAACALRSGALSALSYVAPELRAPAGAAGAATQKGDVFAFGVVLLEAVTGREPTEGEDGLELEAWVRRAFKEERPLSEVVDPTLLGEVHAKKQVLAVFHVALGCTQTNAATPRTKKGERKNKTPGREMGKQQPPPARTPAMSAPPRRRKKKGRPSLLDLQKRSLRLEKLQEPPSQRRSTRRNPNPDSGDEAEGAGRREKKLRLLMGLPDGSAKGEKTRKATDGREEPSDSGPTTPLPDKKLLLFILDRLEKKDTYGVFSEPVDPEELPDYHDIIKHPMDFSTIRKKLDKGAYASLEQFEDDMFLISSNAMCYNSPDTIYYRQARTIQELAKKDFENLRQDSDASEPEPEPEPEPKPEPEPNPQPRRGRPPNKNNVKQKVGRPPAERATADFSGATLATVGSGHHAHSGFDLPRRVMDKSIIADVLRASFANRNNEHNWSDKRKLERIEDYSGSGNKWSAKIGNRPLLMEESRRSTYYQHQPSSSIYELPVSTSYNGARKVLVPVGVQLQQSYPRSLARFAAQLGPAGWEIASKRIERILPPGTKFGCGWVGDGEAPNTFRPPVLTSSSTAMTPPSSTAASSEKPTVNNSAIEDGPASTSHAAGPHPHAVSYASTSTVQRTDSQALPSQQCGSKPQISIDRGEHGVETKGNHNLHESPATQQTVNGFNAVPGSIIFAPTVQMVASWMQTHPAD